MAKLLFALSVVGLVVWVYTLVDTIRNFFKRDYEAADVRQSIDAAVAVRVMEPVFESQTKTKLGSANIGPEGPSLKEFVGKFMQQSLDVYLHRNPETADAILRKTPNPTDYPAVKKWLESNVIESVQTYMVPAGGCAVFEADFKALGIEPQ